MKTMPSCILYSRDEELIGRLIRISSSVAALQPIDEQADLEQWISQFGDTVLLADLRAPNCLELLASIRTERPMTVIIAIGAERSDPMLTAEWLDPYATTNFEPERREFLALLSKAVECLKLRQKNRLLEEELATLNARKAAPAPAPRTLFSAPLQNFSSAQRNFDNIEKLFDSVVEGLVATARVSRAGIFIKPDAEEAYLFQAGTRCLAATEKLSISSGDPFIRWVEMNTHLISRKTLENVSDPQERGMLKHMLDSLGAEIIIPLYANGRIKGWIFVGQRSTGIPFDIADLEDLTGLADHISTTLEKALQYEKTALQKALAETLLHSIPFGIIACDESAIVRWFNNAARETLQTEEKSVIGSQIEVLGSRIADMLRRAIGKQEGYDTREWTDPATKLTLSAETRCLMSDGECVGAMMMLRDVTGAALLQEKEEQLERAAFWNELAASMSHEIRNPLVAIKTFSQLLPTRYEDPDFRSEFSEQVTTEVDQLNHIIDKINEFANPPAPVFQPLDIRKPIEHAVTRIQDSFGHENLKIHLSSDESALQINGDAASLEECVYHLLRNSVENLNNRAGSRVNVTVKSRDPQNGNANLYIIVADNGGGIDASVRDKVFSPFITTKARGFGLGLPIAKRAVIDHNGKMEIETSDGGTSISLTLPALKKASE
ncbi:GAF domain-containing sensor histidine kinase [Pontiella sulfatireligans]|uniref:histidine kinase n=1 Tax=Pontiella sulfatireligans TaxID=2750658 RepID=A0A6C2UR22_9BACT|nr:ATP-binding protein [Pontiella sulfatireligans]VGO22393.1 Sensor protein ZraS [Pontiella sulfatireligans]